MPKAEVAAENPNKKILIVDEEPSIRRAIERTVRQMARKSAVEVELVSVGSAKEAMQRIQDGDRFDLILSDVMMPDQTGVDLHEWVEKEHPDLLPVFCLMSGGMSPKFQVLFEKLEGKGQAINKPWNEDVFRGLIQKVLEGNRL